MVKHRYLATSDVARICQVTAVTVGNWIRSGKLKASRVPGGNYRLSPPDLVRFLKQADMHVPPSLATARTRVLIIDDDQAVIHRIRQILANTDWPCHIDTASDCLTAGAKVIQNDPDLVILDVLMPGIDPRACRQIQQTPSWRHAKVLAFVAPHKPASLAKARTIGADACLTKDFTAGELRSAVVALLFGKSAPSRNPEVEPGKNDE